MSVDWYYLIRSSDALMQGDLIPRCQLPVPSASFYEDILASREEAAQPIDILEADVVIMSQACDIENDKIDSIVVCPYWEIGYFASVNTTYAGTKKIEDLRQGKEPAYHVINCRASQEMPIGFSVVDFHHIYSVPKIYLQQVAVCLTARLRLISPYREHLSQAFARYFMRVGLPSDIDRNALKSAAKQSPQT